MITIIILTGLAILVLIIGFFEIRIPFIHFDSVNMNQRAAAIQNEPKKENIKAKATVRTFKNFFKVNKHEINFRIMHNKETTDIA